ncbi:uncharacterized protein PADG_01072 [Paracoccidioides brasiliensis Pb18]|uniref:Uncharacterized protein n=1 Tax=Paracoccidioides brasiliensis (strain Pb18) TaxID=502780 RepID=C1FZ46_PARBD|nr:uncharacterized protein PADG_01072 [Paracoccidioides brasiliensis Pb18]EEH44783.2 hypothetical protein PADG_01072 [Paracoccidioides brasiliensis Pb18]
MMGVVMIADFVLVGLLDKIWSPLTQEQQNSIKEHKLSDTSEAVARSCVYLDVSTANNPAIHTKEWRTNSWDRSIQEAR